MTHTKLLKLALKYKLGTCSETEKQILFSYCEKVQHKNALAAWTLAEKQAVQKALLQRIHKTITTENTPKKYTAFYKWGAAVVILLLISTTIYFVKNNSTIPTNAVTLTLQGGKQYYFPDTETKQIIKNNTGDTLAYLQKNKLVYLNTTNVGENILSIPYGKKLGLVLSDSSTIELNAGSTITYPVSFINVHQRKITLEGEAFFDVTTNKNKPFVVNASLIDVKVYGTEFNVDAYAEDKQIEVVLVEGAVGVSTKNNKNILHLKPGYKASYSKADKALTKAEVNPEVYTAWISGELVIRKMRFDDILKKLERMYNVTIENNRPELSSEIFNARFAKNTPIETVMNDFKITYSIDYEVIKNNIKTTIIIK